MMQSLSGKIMEETRRLPEGVPVCAKELLHLGSRAAVDQALSRLVRKGGLLRAGRGIYLRPIETRFGMRAPAPEKFVAKFASLRGQTVASHGAAAANALGLTTQVPMRTIYLTSGPSCRLKLGEQVIELKHARPWLLAKPKGQAGEAIRALAWLGPERAEQGLAAIRSRLSKAELTELRASRGTLPEWLARKISTALSACA